MKTTMVRQGDVLLQRCHHLPHQAQPILSPDGRVILAYGEVTGHTHALSAQHAALYEAIDGTRYLRILEKTDLEHEEHGAILLDKGTYQVILQREYSPSAIRTVVD